MSFVNTWTPGTLFYESVRGVSSYVEGDRELREDIERVVGPIDSDALVKAVEES